MDPSYATSIEQLNYNDYGKSEIEEANIYSKNPYLLIGEKNTIFQESFAIKNTTGMNFTGNNTLDNTNSTSKLQKYIKISLATTLIISIIALGIICTIYHFTDNKIIGFLNRLSSFIVLTSGFGLGALNLFEEFN